MNSSTGAFASLAHVRILLVPLGGIPKPKFDACAELVRSLDSVRLVDIPADPREDKSRFMPAPLATGSIHLSYVSHPPPVSHAPLAVFRPSLFPLGVIGIASVPCKSSPAELASQLNASIARAFPPELAPFPLARTCFAFESEESDVGAAPPVQGCVVIPAVMGNKKLYIGQLLADLCSNIVGEFTGLIRALETQHGMDSLAAQALPSFPSASHGELNGNRASLPPLTESPRQSVELSSGNRRSSLVRPRTTSIPHSSSQPDVAHKSISPQPGAMKRSSTQIGTLKQARRATTLMVSNGRLYKVFGDLFLLAGQLDQANVWYTTAQNQVKSAPDSVWQASVLEGMATVAVLEAYAALETSGESAPVSDKELPWSDISDKLTRAINLYAAASPSSMLTDVEYSLFSLLLTDSVLRHSNLLFAIWASKGWGSVALSNMVRPRLPDVFDVRPVPEARLVALDTESKVSRTHISAVLGQAHGPFLVHLRPHDKVRVLSALARTYALLGYRRKEVYILRELLSVLMDMIVCGREEAAQHQSMMSPVTNGAVNGGPQNGTVGVRAHESVVGNASILALVKQVCDIYGAPLDAIGVAEDANVLQAAPLGDVPRKDHFGWPELQVGVVREALAIAEALPDHLAVAQFAFSALNALQLSMSPTDHYHLYTTASRALATAKRRGDERKLDYWAENPVVSVEVLPLPFERMPIQHSTRDLLQASEEETAAVVVGRRDPFLYNPRLKKTSTQQAVAVQGEQLELVVTLHNPYTFDLEVQGLCLSGTGVTLDSQPLSVFVPAASWQPARITVTAPEAGVAFIRGCIARVPGSVRKEFLLPLLTEEEEEKRTKRQSMQALELGRFKRTGLQARSSVRLSGDSASTGAPSLQRFLECKIVAAQPLLKIRRTSLTRSALTLYSGETSSIRLTLENVSKIDVDFIKVTFDDSTIGPAQIALAEGELSVFDTYETEYELIHQPVFTWAAPESQKSVGASNRLVLTVDCFGKIGCTSGTLQISYGYTKPMVDAGEESFYVRQILYPVLVTVYHTLECYGMDILPFGSLDVHERQAVLDANFQLLTDAAGSCDEDDWCLFTIDVRNSYGLPFDVLFERQQDGTPKAVVTHTVAPGSTSRILLPIKRVLLPESLTSQPIPTLSDRQFVVHKDKLSKSEAAAQRELFWYREELFKFVRARWKETGHSRFGQLSLRHQRMTMRMLDNFKIPSVRVRIDIVSSSTAASRRSHQRQSCPANDFVMLHVTVKNMSRMPLVLAVSLALSPADYVLSDGVLSDIPLGRIDCGEEGSIDTGLCFVASGLYTIVAEARCIPSTGFGFERVGMGELRVAVQDTV